jgi:hypothetical protein
VGASFGCATGAPGAIFTYSLIQGQYGMAMDSSIGRLTWTPTAMGNYSVAIKAIDNFGGEATQAFFIDVTNAVRPSVTISSPTNGDEVLGKVFVTGTVKKGTRDVQGVQVQVDSLGWLDEALHPHVPSSK